jgi:hypothetical protein
MLYKLRYYERLIFLAYVLKSTKTIYEQSVLHSNLNDSIHNRGAVVAQSV